MWYDNCWCLDHSHNWHHQHTLVLQLCSEYNYAIWNGVNPKLWSKGVTLFQISAKLNNHNLTLHSIQQAAGSARNLFMQRLIYNCCCWNHIYSTGTAIVYSSQKQEITKPQLIIGQGNMIIGKLTPLSFHTFLLFKYPIRVKLTQNILREILDISLDYWWLRYKCLSDMGGFSLGWNLTKSAFGLSIEFRCQACALDTWGTAMNISKPALSMSGNSVNSVPPVDITRSHEISQNLED